MRVLAAAFAAFVAAFAAAYAAAFTAALPELPDGMPGAHRCLGIHSACRYLFLFLPLCLAPPLSGTSMPNVSA